MTTVSTIVTADSKKNGGIGHVRLEWPVTIRWNERSRSFGIGGHVGVEYATTPSMTGKPTPSISIRFERRRADQVGNQRRHDLRQGQVPGYVDRARSSSNSVLLPPLQAPELRRRCEALAALQPGRHRRLRSNAAVALVGVLSFSKEAQRVIAKLPHKEQDRRILESTREACASLGVELTGLVVHRDESALHAHLQVVARHEDGGPVDLGRKACSSLQDAAARAWRDLGIRRGTPKRERQAREEPASRWVHRSVRQLHEDLPAEIEAAARLGHPPQPRRAKVRVRRRDWIGRLAAALGVELTRQQEKEAYGYRV